MASGDRRQIRELVQIGYVSSPISALTDLRTRWRYSPSIRDDPEACAAMLGAIGRVVRGPVPANFREFVNEVRNSVGYPASHFSEDVCFGLIRGLIDMRLWDEPILYSALERFGHEERVLPRYDRMILLRTAAFTPGDTTALARKITSDFLAEAPSFKVGHADRVANIAWLLAMTEPRNAHIFLGFIPDLKEMVFAPDSLTQIHHAALSCGFELPLFIRRQVGLLSDQMRSNPPKSNRSELSLGRALSRKGFRAKPQGFFELFFNDWEFSQNGRHTVVEFDGTDFHEIQRRGRSLRMWGPTRMKHDLLTHRGHFVVVHILDTDCNGLGDDALADFAEREVLEAWS